MGHPVWSELNLPSLRHNFPTSRKRGEKWGIPPEQRGLQDFATLLFMSFSLVWAAPLR
jgi:hypothetical protein